MLSRHFLRAKVLQALYANKISESTDLKTSIKELTDSISSIYNLEVYLYSALLEIRDIAENQIEDAKTKFLPTEEDLNPNMRFVNNSLLRQLSENMELKGAVKRLKIDWNAEKDILRRVFNQFKNSDSYKEYMEKDVIGYVKSQNRVAPEVEEEEKKTDTALPEEEQDNIKLDISFD